MGFSNDEVTGTPMRRSLPPPVVSPAASVAIELKLPEPSLCNGRPPIAGSLPWLNSTRPLRVLPDSVRIKPESCVSFGGAGRAGEGDVARNNMRSAASVSVGGGGAGVDAPPRRLLLAGLVRPFGVVLPLSCRLPCGRLCVRCLGGVIARG